ncbi:hypothetical protein [Ornithinimicrobium sp. CNJ-824]|uniref:hypothetical protein n=1 Tax=Ornithinimicrobium sp. CNJ-824 TaxID=1904966 RepID=UPI001EDC08A3|nr:hypothetical protein [Ornithinimicrobium sp. CNJ-824]
MENEPTAGWTLPGRPKSAMVTRPGPRVSETVHALLDRGLGVTVATGSPDARLRDLAGRGLVTLAEPGVTDLEEFDVVIRDTAHLSGGDATHLAGATPGQAGSAARSSSSAAGPVPSAF